jgi:cell fate regulator YaaT (PSP1 superfamily)
MDLLKIQLAGGGNCCLFTQLPEGLKAGDPVVVDTADGAEMGILKTVYRGLEVTCERIEHTSGVRAATPEDLAQDEKNRAFEARAFAYCQERIRARQLPIHLVRAACLFDGSKIIFYFTAPGRVDFRDLVKDLVQEFRCRIELRQIGVRHRAKMVGGLGVCGQRLCCASFLKNFEPVSVRMAKEQQLSLNPSKISGVCGRLMCCLVYEYAAYQEIKKHLPKIGKRVTLPEGDAKIIRYNLIRQTVTLELDEGQELEIPLSELPFSPQVKEVKGPGDTKGGGHGRS